MNYIVLDLEWNQAKNNNDIKELQFEIVEIGAVKLDENLSEIDRFSSLVKPKVYKTMNPIIKDITGINEEDFIKEKGFSKVIDEFLNWCGEDYIFCTFGSQDLYELQSNMIYHNYEIPWKYPFKYIDVQKIFGIEFNDFEQRSLEMVSIFFGINGKELFHRALADAIYTSKILKKLNRENFEKYISLDYINVPESEKKSKDINIGTHLEYLSIPYDNKDELLLSQTIHTTRCPECMKKCRKKIKWFSDTSKYVCVAKCENHGLIEGTLNIKKRIDGKYFAIRKVFFINEEQYDKVVLRKEILREKRRKKRIKKK